MKNKLFLISFLFIGRILHSQQTLPDSVESLKITSSPAFVILGVEPDNIQRPSSPKQFIAGIQNSIVNGKLKPNLAIEFTPFYTVTPKDEKSLRFNAYEYLLDENNSVINNIKKSLSISLATSESDTVVYGKLEPGIGLGLGLRFVLVDAKRKKGVMADLRNWQESEIKRAFYQIMEFAIPEEAGLKEVINSLHASVEKYKKVTLLNKAFNGLPYSFACKIVDEMEEEIVNWIKSNEIKDAASVSSLLSSRAEKENALQAHYLTKINNRRIPFSKEGFMLEFAFGHASVLQDNEWKSWKQAKAAFWLTPSYRWSMSKTGEDISLLDVMAVVRYTINNQKDSVDKADYIDAGLKGQFTRNKWSGSVEFISRWASEKPVSVNSNWTYRLATSFDYKINDAFTFKFVFGTHFNGNTATYTDPKKMFAIGGLNLGIFNPKK